MIMRSYKHFTSLAFRRRLLTSNGSFCQCKHFSSLLKLHSGVKTLTKLTTTWNPRRDQLFRLCTTASESSEQKLDNDDGEKLDPLRDSVTFDMHMPVMVSEVLDYFGNKKQQVFLDMTFGAGGHSKILLDSVPDCRIIALDRDPFSYEMAKQIAQKRPGRVVPLLGRFSDLPALMKENGIEPGSIDRALFDFGPSSMHLDDPGRGFSFGKNGPLDMRMDGDRFADDPTAADFVNRLTEATLVQVLERYGDVHDAREIARGIVVTRKSHMIATTRQLATIIEMSSPIMKTIRRKRGFLFKQGRQTDRDPQEGQTKTATKRDKSVHESKGQAIQWQKPKIHVATQTFLALRILVNNELQEINAGLRHVHKYLKPGGLCVALSFHSLEDSIVQHHFCGTDIDPGLLSIGGVSSGQELDDTILHSVDSESSDDGQVLEGDELGQKRVADEFRWHPIGDENRPTKDEIFLNQRSRSAIMRVAKKVR